MSSKVVGKRLGEFSHLGGWNNLCCPGHYFGIMKNIGECSNSVADGSSNIHVWVENYLVESGATGV